MSGTTSIIYKILTTPEWDSFQERAEFTGSAVDIQDGFIHFSAADQVAETAAKHFAGLNGLWLVAVDAPSTGEQLKWEPSRGGALFPHLYETLSLESVRSSHPISTNEQGEFDFSQILDNETQSKT